MPFTDIHSQLASHEFAEDFEEALYQLYINASPSTQEQIRHLRTNGQLKPPPHFRNPYPYCTVDTQTPEQLHRLSTFLVMNDSIRDPRDRIRSLAWHYHTAQLLGLDPDRYFRQLERLASPFMASYLEDFRLRDPKDKSLEAHHLYIATSPLGKYIETRP